MYDENKLLEAIGRSFEMYKKYGARSTKKLLPLHTYIGDILYGIWGEDFVIRYMGQPDGELKVDGKYYRKNVDIAITKEGKPVFCLGIKFATSNYKQNSNNYFENMLGETANIQAMGNLPYAQLLILRHKTPYYIKNETEKSSRIEVINEDNLSKYLKLNFDSKQAHRPDCLSVFLVDIDEDKHKAAATKIEDCLKEEVCGILKSCLSPKNLFEQIKNYKNFYIASCNRG